MRRQAGRNPAPGQPPSLSDQLRTLAFRVERLAVSGRTDAEEVTTEKQLVARSLRRLACEAER